MNQIVKEWEEDKIYTVCRFLILGILIAMTRAFALVNIFEFLLVIFALFYPRLRNETLGYFKDMRVATVLLFLGWVAITMSWGQAPLSERLGDLWSWRKLLLVPLCFALFRSAHHKKWAAIALVGICTIYMVASWLGTFELITLDRDPSKLLENHATQGILFGGASVFCFLWARSEKSIAVYVVASILICGFISNIFFVLTGRSGYLFLIVVVGYIVYAEAGRFRLILAGLASILVLLALLSGETTSSRIKQAFQEIQAVDSLELYTSLGIRVIMWKNTLTLIQNSPVLGSGAGSYYYDYGDLIDPSGKWRSVVSNDPDYQSKLDDWRDVVVDDPHQQYLHIAAEYGLIGLALFLLSLSAWLCSGFGRHDWPSIAAVAILLGTIANGFANGHFSSFVEGRFVWLCLSIFLAGSADRCGDFFRKNFVH